MVNTKVGALVTLLAFFGLFAALLGSVGSNLTQDIELEYNQNPDIDSIQEDNSDVGWLKKWVIKKTINKVSAGENVGFFTNLIAGISGVPAWINIILGVFGLALVYLMLPTY